VVVAMSEDSSHQISMPNSLRVPAQLLRNATTMAREMRVIIAGWRSDSSPRAPRRKTRPP
jgi:hypothetical protein